MNIAPKCSPKDLGRAILMGGLIALLLLAGSEARAGSSYLGKFCFTSTITSRQTGPVSPQTMVSQYDVSSIGGNAYIIVGSVDITNEPFVTTGFGTVIGNIGNKLYLNMTTTQSHADSQWRDTGINQTQLDLSTLSGTFYEVGHDFDPATGSFDNSRYTAGTVALMTCP